VVLGDSFTFGYGVSDGEIFADHLRRLLPEAEIINLGVTAYDLGQEHALLQAEGLAYKPNVVVVALCQNDVIATRRHPAPHQEPTVSRGWKQFLAEHSYLYDCVRTAVSLNKPLSRFLVRIGVKGHPGGYDALDTNLRSALVHYPPELTAQWRAMTDELVNIKTTCDQISALLLVAAIPARQAVEEDALAASLGYSQFDVVDFDLEKPYRTLQEFCRTAGIEFVNAYPAFRQSSERLYIRYDLHFSPQGHALFASLVAPRLRELLAGTQRGF
jgi:lysophospholipase L1-like esterase